MIDFNNIEDIQIDGIDINDYPDFVDAFLGDAIWKDSGKELTDEELEDINDNHSDWVYEQTWEQLC
jgi:hypothetical protein